MTRQRFEVFTPKHGDVVFTTRFRFVARVTTRLVRTLDYDYPIPLVPVEQMTPEEVERGAPPDDMRIEEQEFCECQACEHDCVEADCGPACKLNQW